MGRPRKYKAPTGALIEELIDEKQSWARTNTIKGNLALISQLRQFLGAEFEHKEFTATMCKQFAKYLTTKLKPSTVREYLQQLAAIFTAAEKQGVIKKSPMPDISNLLPHRQEAERVYLTKEELNQMRNTKCQHESTKQAFLFSCYTGLSLLDIETLEWTHIQPTEQGIMLIKTQEKTGVEVRVPLSQSATELLQNVEKLPHRHDDTKVFHLLGRTSLATDLKQWAKDAGITKNISFAVGRHTFATMAISAGVDLFVVSKWCGHTSVQSTQIYADMLKSHRRPDWDTINSIFT